MIARKSAARSAGSATMSTVPSSADAMARSSSTRQSVPTPRQSQVNRPTTASRADWNTATRSPFWPSVSRMACRTPPGRSTPCRSAICPARASQVPIAVAPLARSRCTSAVASARVRALAVAVPVAG
jgi:hypothetical protein